jgi:hypothetical protein
MSARLVRAVLQGGPEDGREFQIREDCYTLVIADVPGCLEPVICEVEKVSDDLRFVYWPETEEEMAIGDFETEPEPEPEIVQELMKAMAWYQRPREFLRSAIEEETKYATEELQRRLGLD